jgi:hypothetical protein
MPRELHQLTGTNLVRIRLPQKLSAAAKLIGVLAYVLLISGFNSTPWDLILRFYRRFDFSAALLK